MLEIEGAHQPSSKKATPSSSTTVSNPRTLSPSVTCSDRRLVPRQVWVESLNAEVDRYLDIVDLHPDVFATFPRLDLIHKNLYWQAHYRIVVRLNIRVF